MAKPSPAIQHARQARNIAAILYWGAGIIGVIVLFSAFHWAAELFQRRRPASSWKLTKTARTVRSVLMRRVPYVTTVGHGLIITVYIGINVAVTVTSINWDDLVLTLIAKRLGWVATSNLVLLTFLALKNTPLAFLSARSYERLNVFHRFAGMITILAMLGHVLVHIAELYESNSLGRLLQFKQIMGIIAGGSMIAIGITALFLHKILYETFYIIHIVCFMLVLITLGMHRPDPMAAILWMVVFAAALWFSDRLIRLCRILWYAGDNTATVTTLPHDGMRIVLNRFSHRAVPGSHIYLWIPSIRAFESHPFTVVSTNPIELVVKVQDGFTRDLQKVTAHSDIKLKASMDGPYGSLPDYNLFDHIVFFAGGSGASFTFGIACNLVRMGRDKRHSISFHWIIRMLETLSWFKDELNTLQSSSEVNSTIHITDSTFAGNNEVPQPSPAALSFSQIDNLTVSISPSIKQQLSLDSNKCQCSPNLSLEKENLASVEQIDFPNFLPTKESSIDAHNTPSVKSLASSSSDPLQSDPTSNLRSRTILRRPDIGKLVTRDIEEAGQKLKLKGRPNGRALVVVCGPQRMVRDVRGSVASWVSRGVGVGVELLVEEFGW